MSNNTDKRTPGKWAAGYGDSSNAYGIFTEKMLDNGMVEHPICLISPIDTLSDVDFANAAYIVEAANNYPLLKEQNKLLLDALKKLVDEFDGIVFSDKSDPLMNKAKNLITQIEKTKTI